LVTAVGAARVTGPPINDMDAAARYARASPSSDTAATTAGAGALYHTALSCPSGPRDESGTRCRLDIAVEIEILVLQRDAGVPSSPSNTCARRPSCHLRCRCNNVAWWRSNERTPGCRCAWADELHQPHEWLGPAPLARQRLVRPRYGPRLASHAGATGHATSVDGGCASGLARSGYQDGLLRSMELAACAMQAGNHGGGGGVMQNAQHINVQLHFLGYC
jgi:hypothetical protein